MLLSIVPWSEAVHLIAAWLRLNNLISNKIARKSRAIFVVVIYRLSNSNQLELVEVFAVIQLNRILDGTTDQTAP